jgi:aerobic carbon-monoxide dehydrogenase medium subunit
VKPAPFTYHRPATLGDAVRLLSELAPQDGRVLAGGQSLVPIMAFRLARPAHLIDINAIAGLGGLAMRNGKLCIGARVRHADFQRPIGRSSLGTMLAVVVRHIAHYPIRQRGTFCGSLAHADPAAEWCVVAATLDAELVAVSAQGERAIGARDFFRGAMDTALAPEELLCEARLPLLSDDTCFGFAEFSRRAGDYALAMALAVFRVEGGRIVAPRIGLGGVEAVPRRIAAAEWLLQGEIPGPEVFQAAAAAAAASIAPLEDPQTDAQYRRELAQAMVYRALTRACPPPGGNA